MSSVQSFYQVLSYFLEIFVLEPPNASIRSRLYLENTSAPIAAHSHIFRRLPTAVSELLFGELRGNLLRSYLSYPHPEILRGDYQPFVHREEYDFYTSLCERR